MTGLFHIESKDIKLLNDIQLTQVLKLLLHNESNKFGLVQSSVDVALNINVGDGGEDGRISWSNSNIKETDYIPKNLTIFQCKATNMNQSEYANEITKKVTINNKISIILKPLVEDVFDKKGAYIVFTTQELNHKQKTERIDSIRDKLEELNKDYFENCRIEIYDSSLISGWVNQFVSTVVYVAASIGKTIARGLKSFESWEKTEDFNLIPYIKFESREDIIDDLTENICNPRECFRITALSGLGKTRLVYNIFRENDNIKHQVVYTDASSTNNVDALIDNWINQKMKVILVVDNCDYKLHERLVREVKRTDSEISLITIDYNFETVGNTTKKIRLEPLTDGEILTLLKPKYESNITDLHRIVKFAQGFPKMAVLIAEARLVDNPQIGELTEDDIANKLLWRRDEIEDREVLEILQVCSLFDTFGIEGEAEKELEYISGLLNRNVDDVYECLKSYENRSLIDHRGRYAQLVPKPLAIRLASQWWRKTRKSKQQELINSIPDNMIERFCMQIEKLDYLPEVKNLTTVLCGENGPFGDADLIFSDRGSRLFRSFVVVNPEVTSRTLYRVITSLTLSEIEQVSGTVRRNLVNSLEMLCFHSKYFDESAWSLLLLACAENESWSNNASGIFEQLFKIRLSGTEANPEQRIKIIEIALKEENLKFDLIILKVLEVMLEIGSGSRMVGAEYQGTKSPLEEWKPTIWQEIFDYWEKAYSFLLFMLERGPDQKKTAIDIIGKSFRIVIRYNRIELIDNVINAVVAINGKYWPSALESLQSTQKYDSDNYGENIAMSIERWLELLSPDKNRIDEMLKIIVLSPPWNHIKSEEGNYVDQAALEAQDLASELATSIESLYPYIQLLLVGEQRQSLVFGSQLVECTENPDNLINTTLNQLEILENPNPRFALGLYNGLSKKSDEVWQENLELLYQRKKLTHFYPSFVMTGNIRSLDLTRFLEMLINKEITTNSLRPLRLQNLLDTNKRAEILMFLSSLNEIGNDEKLLALDIIETLSLSIENDFIMLLKKITSSVELNREKDINSSDMYVWHKNVMKLLEIDDSEFAISLSNHFISECSGGFDYGTLWSYLHPVIEYLFKSYSNDIWPQWSMAIMNCKGDARYWISELFKKRNTTSMKYQSPIAFVDTRVLLDWCDDNIDNAPLFIAEHIDIVFEPRVLHSLFFELMSKYGSNKRLGLAFRAFLLPDGWSGSLIPFYEENVVTLEQYNDESNNDIRKWIIDTLSILKENIEYEKQRESERQMGVFH